jgi:hypothetical protein
VVIATRLSGFVTRDQPFVTMRSRFRLAFVVFYFTAVLILAVYLRDANKRFFYQLCTYEAERKQLKQELWQKQLQLESLINPAAISQRLDE